MNNELNLAAPCLFGVESIAADEFRRMGFNEVAAENGRVKLKGDLNMLARANICSRFAERIMIVLGEFTLNLRRRTLLKNGRNIELTQVEFQMIEYFFNNPDVALDRTDILSKVWGTNYFGEEKIVDVNVRRLRMKVEDDPSQPQRLITVWGMGYKWNTH